MPDLSTQTLDEVFSQYMPTTPLSLIRYVGVDNQGNEITRRYVNDYSDIVSNGQIYSKAAFEISLGSDEADNMPTVNLVFDSGDRTIVNQLREFNESPKVYYSVIIAERPDVVEIPEIEFNVKDWVLKDSTVSLTLETEPVLNEPIVGDIVTPQLFPFLWNNVTVSEV